MKYIWDKQINLFRRAHVEAFAYSDGAEVEQRLYQIMQDASDRSTFSTELVEEITDWPSEYHLSRARHCLVRPLGIKPGEKVLELGCGCGVITRYLGEVGAEVVAVEGSIARARIAAERCCDLDNVKVFVDDLLHFETEERFDWVLLVGVLEYAPVFTDEKEPMQQYLRAVVHFLAPDGKLVIAIENKLGLKYFNNCSEDHLGVPFYGVQDLYGAKTPRTFGRLELLQQLSAAGFSNCYFYYPFPDYKLPSVVLSDEALKDPQFDAVDLIIRSHARDYLGSPYRLFDEALVFSTLSANGLLADFSNSFLVVATPENVTPHRADRLAMTFAINRVPEFSVVTSFYRRDDVIHVVKEPVFKDLPRHRRSQDGFNIINVPGDSIYQPGRQLLWRLLSVRTKGGTLDEVVAELRPWLSYLLEAAVTGGAHEPFVIRAGEQHSLEQWVIPGSYLDCTPFNLIETRQGDLVFIDNEWQVDSKVPLGWVITRGVLYSLVVGLAPGNSIKSVADVVQMLCRSAGLSVTEAEVAGWIEQEAGFQSIVTGQALSDISISIGHCVSGLISLSHAVAERDGQITSLSHAVAERDGQITSLSHAVAERDGQITSLSHAVIEREGQINRIFASKSWRLTKPLRWIGRVFRGEFTLAMEPINRLLNKVSKERGTSVTDDSRGGLGEENGTHSNYNISFLPPIVVILPVYRDIEMTRRCILAAIPGILDVKNAIMLAINDASPDTGMQEMLEEFVVKWPETFVLLKNDKNLGFVRTVNRGLTLYQTRDVVLLNSDVVVPQEWLARLGQEAYSLPNVATVTPLSNNATICSFPVFLEDNKLFFGLDVDSVDQVFKKYKLPCVEAPTGVGFCMYIRRACLDQIGYLNEERFGRGYGEENDLCQRALKSGWVNLVTPNMFVFHEGGVSFSKDKQALVDRAMRTIDELHPNYHRDVQEFIKNDPLKMYRISRYLQLLSIIRIPKILLVSHEMGGGVQQHVEELSKYYGNRVGLMLLRPLGGDNAVVLHLISGQKGADELSFSLPDDYSELVVLLKEAGVSLIHFHHTYGLNPIIWSLPSDLNVPHILTVHDFYWLNGNPTLTNENGCYTGPFLDEPKNPLFPLPDGVDVQTWRKNLRPLIESAKMVVFPSHASKRIFDKSYKFRCSVVTPHIEINRNVAAPAKPFQTVGVVTIGVLGALGREKGADFLEEIAIMAHRSGCDLKFKLIGYTYRPLTAVEVTGPYKVQELSALIKDYKIDVVFFPARWPETYSYTLSFALESGLPVIAPDIGAFPERLSGRKNVLLFKHGTTASEFLKQLIEFIEKLSKGDNIYAPLAPELLVDHGFYASTYIDIATKSLVVRDVKDAIPMQLSSKLCKRTAVHRISLNRRERVLALLWCLYQHPYISRVARWIPFNIKRAVKRALSSRPIHEVWRESK